MTTSTSTTIGIDSTEQLTPLNRIRCRATGRDGAAPHISTMIRWITKGARLSDGSRVRLRAVRTPGGWRSCSRWLDEFHDALTRDRLGIVADDATSQATATASPVPAPIPRRRTPRERLEASRRAGELLASLGC